jgi:hypothetical protein
MSKGQSKEKHAEELPLRFDQKLVLFRWMLRLCDVATFEKPGILSNVFLGYHQNIARD